MNNLLNALGDRVKPAGKNYIARCPVHDDKDFAMSIKQKNDGSLTIQCYACSANGLDLYRFYGLELDELFGYRAMNKTKEWIPPRIKDQYDEDRLVVAMFEGSSQPTWQDRKRYRLAVARIKGTEDKFNI